MKILIGFSLCVVTLVRGFLFSSPARRGCHLQEHNLHDIDTKMENMLNEMKKLKRDKVKILSNIRGLKLHDYSDDEEFKGDEFGGDKFDDDEIDNDIEGGGENEGEEFFPFPQAHDRGRGRRVSLPKNIGVRFFKQITGGAGAGNGDPDSDDKSENFEVIRNTSMSFKDIGGYDSIKKELMQCSDLLLHHDKYAKYNVRVPKGLILEGPPGNGKTLLAKCFSGEINVGFIAVSGAQFQEKYVGVGASRIRELFQLAMKNRPCIIFIDEIDALGRKRSNDDNSNNAERDTTLNELLVSLDGFKNTNGVFLLASTNRVDLLDSALTRPGRIDKSVFVGLPDTKTREAIVKIHIQGKPIDKTVTVEQLVEMTQGCSGAQIENLLNEAMLLALRDNREIMTHNDLEFILTRILVGWQSTEHTFTAETLYQISIHEMGHAVVGLFADKYRKLIKVSLNAWSPKNPGFTLFETDDDTKIHTKQTLFSHLMVLLGGRIAEELFFSGHISTGASHDLDQARQLAEQMIGQYGMGKKLIYPFTSNKYREIIDQEINDLIDAAYTEAKFIIMNSKPLIEDCAKQLMEDHIMTEEQIVKKNRKYAK
jgi:cell division protease FtsH